MSFRTLGELQQPLLLEADVLAITDHDMIEDANPEKLAGVNQSSGNGDIFFGRTRIATRVVMHEEHRTR